MDKIIWERPEAENSGGYESGYRVQLRERRLVVFANCNRYANLCHIITPLNN